MALRSADSPPLERVHFLEEQRRHRRTSIVSAALVVVVLAVSGIPLSVLISPVLVAAAAVPVYLADIVFDIPVEVTGWLDRAFHLLPTMWSAVRRPDVDMPWDWLVGLFVLPGLVAMVLLWAVVRMTFRRTGVGGVLRRMEARPPRSGDLAEQRLANLVEEVAVAAAVPPPRVLLIDSKAANVGAAGLTMDDATVVVTRGFVDRLPRDQQQAVIAHVMASIGNGDLTLAAEILTLMQVWGLVSLMLEAPMVPMARASLKLVGRTARDTLRGRADAPSRELAVDTLLAGATFENLDSDEFEALPDVHPLVLLFGYFPVLITHRPRGHRGQGHHLAHRVRPGALRVLPVAHPPEAGGRDCGPADPLSRSAGPGVPDPRGPGHDGAGGGGGALPLSGVGPGGGPGQHPGRRDQRAAPHAAPARASAPAAPAARRGRGWCGAVDRRPRVYLAGGRGRRRLDRGRGGAPRRRGSAECDRSGGGVVRARVAVE